MKREVYWHLPGLCTLRYLNQILLNLMEKYPEKFKKGYKISSVYGTFPGAVWNGGRAAFGMTSKGDIEKLIKAYNSKGVAARFTWTNSLLEEKHLSDTYCNLIMKLAANGKNQVLVNRKILEDYIRKEYPMFRIISSTTKRILDMDALLEEVSKDYYLVVLDYDLNHNEKVLSKLEPYAGKIEILVNEICVPNCKKRLEHYRSESQAQLDFDAALPFRCPHDTKNRSFSECKKRPAFISNEEIDSYIERGFVNFKIVGRGLSQEFARDSYLYYLVNEQDREFIADKIDKTLLELASQYKQMRK